MAASLGRVLLSTRFGIISFSKQESYILQLPGNVSKRYVDQCKRGHWSLSNESPFGGMKRNCIHTLALGLAPSVARRYATSFTQRCWKCKTHIDTEKEQYFCKCGLIQPPIPERNFYEVMEVECSFDLDQRELSENFRRLQKRLHPDKFSIKSNMEKEYSALQSAIVNKAYRTLQKPMARGLYLLELHGHSLQEDEVLVEPTFLMDIMETNEQLAETKDRSTLETIQMENNAILEDLMDDVSRAFKDKDICTAKALLTRLKYYANIDDKVKDALEKVLVVN